MEGRRSAGGVQRDREREREKEKERERRERRHSSHSSSAAVHAAKKQRIAETKQQDEDPFAVTPENVHKTQMIDADTDMILRYFGCLLMRKAAGLLRLPARTACTAQYYFHRFYDLHPLHKLDIALMAQSCLYLACKAEETLRKARDVINSCYFLLQPQQPMLKIGKKYWDLRDEVVAAEQILLRTLDFDLTFIHPHKFLLNYINSLNGSQALAQVSWNLTNDLYYTPLCMQRNHRPHVLACSSLYLAQFILEQSNMEVRQSMQQFPWWEVFDAKKQDLEEVSSSLLDSLQTLQAIPYDTALMVYQEYAQKYSPPSPLQLAKAAA
jgi:hypothetical protein